MIEKCWVCEHTDSGMGANYLFRFSVFNIETKTKIEADVHLRCIPAFFVDRQDSIFQCIGRVRDILEAERVARVEAKRAEQEANHTFEEPTDDSDDTDPSDSDSNRSEQPQDSTRPPTGDQPHLRLLA